MTPQEKAKELVFAFHEVPFGKWTTTDEAHAKQCALIAVKLRLEGHFPYSSVEYGEDSTEYWEEVRTEIEKL